jgi:zinc transporter
MAVRDSKKLKTICAFDISKDGIPTLVNADGPSANCPTGAAYRWLHFDLQEPLLERWADEFLPELAAHAMRQKETRPRFDTIGDGQIINFRGVNLNDGSDPEDMVSVRLWVSDGLIVSARIRKVWAVDAIRQEMDAGKAPKTLGKFLTTLSFGLTKRIEKVSLVLEEQTDVLEENVFSDLKNLSAEVATSRQSVIKLRRFIRPQREALVEMAESRSAFFDEEDAGFLSETANKATRTLEALDATHDRLNALQDHLDIQHASALGRNSYVLSVVAAIFLPLGFLTGLFGINVGGMPGVEAAYGFWIVTGGTFLIGVLLYLVFRFLKWI